MKLVTLEQGSPAWKQWRLGGIGGSDAAAILGVAPFEDATRENVLREKVTGRERETNFSMRRGNRLEPQARSLYELKTGCDAPPACVEHADAAWMRVSLDGLCRPRPAAETWVPWVLELKCPNWMVHDLALEGIVADYYRPQCQWQLLVTGLDRLDFVSFNDGRRFREEDQLAVVPVGPDAELQGRLLYECERFWREVEAARAGTAAASA